jgi:hypothetical protein
MSEKIWQLVYDSAANEGTILHDDTVSAIVEALDIALPDVLLVEGSGVSPARPPQSLQKRADDLSPEEAAQWLESIILNGYRTSIHAAVLKAVQMFRADAARVAPREPLDYEALAYKSHAALADALRERPTCWCDSLRAAGAGDAVKCPPCMARESAALVAGLRQELQELKDTVARVDQSAASSPTGSTASEERR